LKIPEDLSREIVELLAAPGAHGTTEDEKDWEEVALEQLHWVVKVSQQEVVNLAKK